MLMLFHKIKLKVIQNNSKKIIINYSEDIVLSTLIILSKGKQ